jgi:hypothetical protein
MDMQRPVKSRPLITADALSAEHKPKICSLAGNGDVSIKKLMKNS